MSESAPQQALVGDWFGEHYPRLVRFLARRLGSRGAEVEDLAQEAFLRLLRVERAELIRNPQAYLHQVAANVLLEWRLRARQRKPHSSEFLDTMIANESPEEQAGTDQTRQLMRRALKELPPLCQAVLMLRGQGDMDNEAIAQQLGVTRRMVKRHLELGYALLRDKLSRLNL